MLSIKVAMKAYIAKVLHNSKFPCGAVGMSKIKEDGHKMVIVERALLNACLKGEKVIKS